VRDFAGRWGRDTRDPFGGESAPTGPKHERDGIDRVRWEDPLGWAGMHKVDPDPAAGSRAIVERRREVERRITEIDEQVDSERHLARREVAEVAALEADAVTQPAAGTRREVLAVRDATILALRDERRRLTAEADALAIAERDGLPPTPARAHLGARAPDDEVVDDDMPRVRRRVLRIWAAISTPLLMVIIVWLLVGNSSHYYWLGAVAGVLLVLGFESLARGRLLAFLGWSIVFVVGLTVLVGLIEEWRLTLGVLLLVGAIVLLSQNVRELRSTR
jgi:hypothetical protein